MHAARRYPLVVMIRHAQSEWNRQDRFTGWADPPLTAAGRAEAERAGRQLAARGHRFDRVYTSRLSRARDTADILLRQSGNDGVAVVADWRLNERHYGALQGQDKAAMVRRVGEAQVWRWRRGYHERPPVGAADHPDHSSRDHHWSPGGPGPRLEGESLAATRRRVMAFWREQAAPQLRAGRRLLIASHGNTLRALIMALDGMSVAEVEQFEIPTAVPIVYAFSPEGRPMGWRYLDTATHTPRAA